jgi:hypothetical protein
MPKRLAVACGAAALAYFALGLARFYYCAPDPGRAANGILGASSYAGAAAIVSAIVFGVSCRSYRLAGGLFLLFLVAGALVQFVYLRDDLVWARRVELVREMNADTRALSAEAQRVARGGGDRTAVLQHMDAVADAVDEAAGIEQGHNAAKLRGVSEYVAETRRLLADVGAALPAYGEALEPFPGRYTGREQMRRALAATDAYLAANRALYEHLGGVRAFFEKRLRDEGVPEDEIAALAGELSEERNHVAGLAVRETELAMSTSIRAMLAILERHWGAWTWRPAGDDAEGGSVEFAESVPAEDVERYRLEGRRHLEWAEVQADLQRSMREAAR